MDGPGGTRSPTTSPALMLTKPQHASGSSNENIAGKIAGADPRGGRDASTTDGANLKRRDGPVAARRHGLRQSSTSNHPPSPSASRMAAVGRGAGPESPSRTASSPTWPRPPGGSAARADKRRRAPSLRPRLRPGPKSIGPPARLPGANFGRLRPLLRPTSSASAADGPRRGLRDGGPQRQPT